MAMTYEEAKKRFKMKGIGRVKYMRIRAYMELLGKPCDETFLARRKVQRELIVTVKDVRIDNPNIREGLTEELKKARAEAIGTNKNWWLESEMSKEKEWNHFLKCPFGLERKELWFYHQVRSGTLHTKMVMRKLYNASLDEKCLNCGAAPESILHLLVECDAAISARKKLVEEMKAKLDRLMLPDSAKIVLWFDDTIYEKGKIQPRNIKRSSEGLLEGLMGKEGDFRKELLDEMVLSGRKQREAEKVIRCMVDSMKRTCVKALHKVYINSVVKRSEALLST